MQEHVAELHPRQATRKKRPGAVPDEAPVLASLVCKLSCVGLGSPFIGEGLRGDIVTNRAARAYCAFDGRDEVTDEDPNGGPAGYIYMYVCMYVWIYIYIYILYALYIYIYI